MKRFLLMTGLFVAAGCSTGRAPSLNMLEKRADYDAELRTDEAMADIENPILVPNRTIPRVTDIWVHPHEMPTGDYFRGGWIRTIISDSHWQMETRSAPKVEGNEVDPKKTKATKTKPIKKK